MQDVVTLGAHIAGHHVTQRVVAHMPHVDAARGIGEHLELVALGLLALVLGVEAAAFGPHLLPVLLAYGRACSVRLPWCRPSSELEPASSHGSKIEIFFHEPKVMLASRLKEDIMGTRWAKNRHMPPARLPPAATLGASHGEKVGRCRHESPLVAVGSTTHARRCRQLMPRPAGLAAVADLQTRAVLTVLPRRPTPPWPSSGSRPSGCLPRQWRRP